MQDTNNNNTNNNRYSCDEQRLQEVQAALDEVFNSKIFLLPQQFKVFFLRHYPTILGVSQNTVAATNLAASLYRAAQSGLSYVWQHTTTPEKVDTQTKVEKGDNKKVESNLNIIKENYILCIQICGYEEKYRAKFLNLLSDNGEVIIKVLQDDNHPIIQEIINTLKLEDRSLGSNSPLKDSKVLHDLILYCVQQIHEFIKEPVQNLHENIGLLIAEHIDFSSLCNKNAEERKIIAKRSAKTIMKLLKAKIIDPAQIIKIIFKNLEVGWPGIQDLIQNTKINYKTILRLGLEYLYAPPTEQEEILLEMIEFIEQYFSAQQTTAAQMLVFLQNPNIIQYCRHIILPNLSDPDSYILNKVFLAFEEIMQLSHNVLNEEEKNAVLESCNTFFIKLRVGYIKIEKDFIQQRKQKYYIKDEKEKQKALDILKTNRTNEIESLFKTQVIDFFNQNTTANITLLLNHFTSTEFASLIRNQLVLILGKADISISDCINAPNHIIQQAYKAFIKQQQEPDQQISIQLEYQSIEKDIDWAYHDFAYLLVKKIKDFQYNVNRCKEIDEILRASKAKLSTASTEEQKTYQEKLEEEYNDLTAKIQDFKQANPQDILFLHHQEIKDIKEHIDKVYNMLQEIEPHKPDIINLFLTIILELPRYIAIQSEISQIQQQEIALCLKDPILIDQLRALRESKINSQIQLLEISHRILLQIFNPKNTELLVSLVLDNKTNALIEYIHYIITPNSEYLKQIKEHEENLIAYKVAYPDEIIPALAYDQGLHKAYIKIMRCFVVLKDNKKIDGELLKQLLLYYHATLESANQQDLPENEQDEKEKDKNQKLLGLVKCIQASEDNKSLIKDLLSDEELLQNLGYILQANGELCQKLISMPEKAKDLASMNFNIELLELIKCMQPILEKVQDIDSFINYYCTILENKIFKKDSQKLKERKMLRNIAAYNNLMTTVLEDDQLVQLILSDWDQLKKIISHFKLVNQNLIDNSEETSDEENSDLESFNNNKTKALLDFFDIVIDLKLPPEQIKLALKYLDALLKKEQYLIEQDDIDDGEKVESLNFEESKSFYEMLHAFSQSIDINSYIQLIQKQDFLDLLSTMNSLSQDDLKILPPRMQEKYRITQANIKILKILVQEVQSRSVTEQTLFFKNMMEYMCAISHPNLILSMTDTPESAGGKIATSSDITGKFIAKLLEDDRNIDLIASLFQQKELLSIILVKEHHNTQIEENLNNYYNKIFLFLKKNSIKLSNNTIKIFLKYYAITAQNVILDTQELNTRKEKRKANNDARLTLCKEIEALKDSEKKELFSILNVKNLCSIKEILFPIHQQFQTKRDQRAQKFYDVFFTVLIDFEKEFKISKIEKLIEVSLKWYNTTSDPNITANHKVQAYNKLFVFIMHNKKMFKDIFQHFTQNISKYQDIILLFSLPLEEIDEAADTYKELYNKLFFSIIINFLSSIDKDENKKNLLWEVLEIYIGNEKDLDKSEYTVENQIMNFLWQAVSEPQNKGKLGNLMDLVFGYLKESISNDDESLQHINIFSYEQFGDLANIAQIISNKETLTLWEELIKDSTRSFELLRQSLSPIKDLDQLDVEENEEIERQKNILQEMIITSAFQAISSITHNKPLLQDLCKIFDQILPIIIRKIDAQNNELLMPSASSYKNHKFLISILIYIQNELEKMLDPNLSSKPSRLKLILESGLSNADNLYDIRLLHSLIKEGPNSNNIIKIIFGNTAFAKQLRQLMKTVFFKFIYFFLPAWLKRLFIQNTLEEIIAAERSSDVGMLDLNTLITQNIQGNEDEGIAEFLLYNLEISDMELNSTFQDLVIKNFNFENTIFRGAIKNCNIENTNFDQAVFREPIESCELDWASFITLNHATVSFSACTVYYSNEISEDELKNYQNSEIHFISKSKKNASQDQKIEVNKNTKHFQHLLSKGRSQNDVPSISH